MSGIKSLKQDYSPYPAIIDLMDTFTMMVNVCIDAALDHNLTSRNRISKEVYHSINMTGLPTYYCASAINMAASLVKGTGNASGRGEIWQAESHKGVA